MARRGVWQLEKLCLSYCEFSGSSQGARWNLKHKSVRKFSMLTFLKCGCSLRQFLANGLPPFKEDNQWLQVDTKIRRGQHPFFTARFREWKMHQLSIRRQSVKWALHISLIDQNTNQSLLSSNSNSCTGSSVLLRTGIPLESVYHQVCLDHSDLCRFTTWYKCDDLRLGIT